MPNVDYESKKKVGMAELNKVDKMIYQWENIPIQFQEDVSDYFVDAQNLKDENMHYNKVLGDKSVNISFSTLKKIANYYSNPNSKRIKKLINNEIKKYKEKQKGK